MAFGEKKPVVMEADKAVPNGVATLDSTGKLAESQRFEDKNKQNKLTGNPGQLIGIGDNGAAVATVYPCNKNFVINWDFTNPVNRNGKTKYGESQWCIDKWYNRVGTSVSLEDGGLRLSVEVSGNYRRMVQILENKGILGQTITISALVDEVSVGAGTFQIDVRDAYAAGGTTSSENLLQISTKTPGLITATGKLPAATQLPELAIVLTFNHDTPDESYAKIRAVKLEFGEFQTLAHKEGDEWVLNEIQNYAEQYVLCEQYDSVSGEFIGRRYVNKNILVNSDFRNPVNTQGLTKYTAAGNFIDRWYSNGVANSTVEVRDEKLICTTTSTSVTGFFSQRVQDSHLYYGKVVTASALLDDGNLYSVTGTVPKEATTSNQRFGRVSLPNSGNLDLYVLSSGQSRPSAVGALEPQFEYKGNGYGVIACKLELGNIQTLAHLENGEWVLNDPPQSYAEQYSICEQSILLTDDFVGINYINENLLDNPLFTGIDSHQYGDKFPINQSAKTEFTTNGTTVDRWLHMGANFKVSLQEDGIKLSASNTATALVQRISDPLLINRTYTFSVLCSDGLYVLTALWDLTTTKDIVFDDGFGLRMALAANGLPSMSIRFNEVQSEAPREKLIIAAKLELGPYQTLAHKERGNWVLNEIPDYSWELMKCRRHKIVINYTTRITPVGIGLSNGTTCRIFIPTPEPLHTLPTIDSKSLIIYRGVMNENFVVKNIVVQCFTSQGVYCSVTSETAIESKQGVMLFIDEGGYLSLDSGI